MMIGLRQFRHRLCQGDATIRQPEENIGLRCLYLHRQNPYLRLGPFKLDILNREPFVGMARHGSSRVKYCLGTNRFSKPNLLLTSFSTNFY